MSEESLPRRPRMVAIISISVVVLLIAIYIGQQFNIVTDYLTRDSWESTSGVVVRHNNRANWLLYEFIVDGEAYYGTRLSLTEDSTFNDNNYNLRANYPEGLEVTVYYNPENPTRSALSTDASLTRYLVVIAGIGIIIGFGFVARWLLGRYLTFVRKMLSGKS